MHILSCKGARTLDKCLCDLETSFGQAEKDCIQGGGGGGEEAEEKGVREGARDAATTDFYDEFCYVLAVFL